MTKFMTRKKNKYTHSGPIRISAKNAIADVWGYADQQTYCTDKLG